MNTGEQKHKSIGGQRDLMAKKGEGGKEGGALEEQEEGQRCGVPPECARPFLASE